MRPEAGTQAQFKKRREHAVSAQRFPLASLDCDGRNPVREFGEWLVAQIDEASQLDPSHQFDSAR